MNDVCVNLPSKPFKRPFIKPRNIKQLVINDHKNTDLRIYLLTFIGPESATTLLAKQ